MQHEALYRLDRLSGQLAEMIMSVAFCIQEIKTIVRTEINGAHEMVSADADVHSHTVTLATSRPLMIESTLSVFWKGKTLFIGHNHGFRILERLARRPNQFVTHLDLLHDVWDDKELSICTIRSVVRHLRTRLREGGMAELAAAIRGYNGRYVLEL